jgi:hypothetical protein
MRPSVLIFAAALAAAILAAALHFSLSSTQKETSRAEFAKILLQGGVIGALGLGIKKLLDDWEKNKQSAARRQEQARVQQKYLTEMLIELRKRFRLALQRTKESDRLESPTVWASLLLEGGIGSEWREDSRDLVSRIQILLTGLELRGMSGDVEEINKIFAQSFSVKARTQGPVDEHRWAEIREELERGYRVVDGLFWVAGLQVPSGTALPGDEPQPLRR